MNRDDDRNWKYGIIYFNRDDPDLVVPKRNIDFGGRTLNYARPMAWIISIGIPVGAATLAYLSKH